MFSKLPISAPVAIAAVSALAAVALGAVVVQKYVQAPALAPMTQPPAPSVSPPNQATTLLPPPTQPDTAPSGISDTSNWQTYRNEEYGFEVKYPASWFIIQDKAFDLIIGSTKMPIKLSKFGDVLPPRNSAAIDFGYSASALENYGMTPSEIYMGPNKDDVIIFEEKFYDQTTGSLGAEASYWKNDPGISQYEKIFDHMVASLHFK